MKASSLDFDDFRLALLGLEVSHVWQGHGSALFLEFGDLTDSELSRRDGSPGNPQGQMGLMVEWSWRIEDATSIVCGSWSEGDLWEPAFKRLKGSRISEVVLFGRLPELSLGLENGLFVVSFMTADGGPEWALGDRRTSGVQRWLSVKDGQLDLEIV